MRLYLSSYGIGDRPNELKALLNGGTKVANISNARDYKTRDERAVSVQRDKDSLAALGFEVTLVDLRQFFGKPEELRQQFTDIDLIWVPGGNVFILRQAYALSGFDEILKEFLASDSIVYGGYSAGVCVLSPSLKGLELVDDSSVIPDGYSKEIIWEGLGVIDYSVAPHYKSNHPESEDIDKLVAYFKENNVTFRAMRDGEVIVVREDKEKLDKGLGNCTNVIHSL